MSPPAARPTTRKRDKYTRNACDDCQRRKIKCSGELPCPNCRLRNIECHISSTVIVSKRVQRTKSTSPATNNPTVDVVQQKSKVGRSRQHYLGGSSTSSTSPSRSHKINNDKDKDNNDDPECTDDSDYDDYDDENSSRIHRRKRARHSRKTSLTPPPAIAAPGIAATPWFQLLQDNILHQLEQRLCEQSANSSSRSNNQGDFGCLREASSRDALGTGTGTGTGTQTPKRLDVATLLDPDTAWQSPHAIGALLKTIRSDASHGLLPFCHPPSLPRRPTRLCVPDDSFAGAIQLCFNEIDGYFPYFIADRPGLQDQMQSALRDSSEASSCESGLIMVHAKHHHLIALLCVMVAMGLNSRAVAASRNDGISTPPTKLPGQKLYDESRKLIDHFEGAMPATLELLRYHVVAVGWVFVFGNWQLARYHVIQGLHSLLNMPAMDVENDNGGNTREVRVEVERAWHTLRHFDKRIAQSAGVQHIIRHEYYSADPSGPHSAFELDNCSHFTIAQGMITSMLDHDQLWETMWDQFLAPNASKASGWAERRALDSKIVASQQLLPSQLGLTTSSVQHLQGEGEWELFLRRRLVIQLRYQQLRMKLWHRIELASDLEQHRSQQCFEVAQQVVEAISTYMILLPSPLASLGLHSTIALIEAIHHIVAEVRNPTSQVGPEQCSAALQVASGLLYKLADSHIMAQHACRMLSGVLKASQKPNVMESNIGSEMVPGNLPMEIQTSLLTNQDSQFSWDSCHWDIPELTSVVTASTDGNLDFDVDPSNVDPGLSFELRSSTPMENLMPDLTPDKLSHWLTDVASIWET